MTGPALVFARRLIDQGVPVFVAHPNRDRPGEFHYPRGWEKTTPNPRLLEAWKPGMALCAVTGVALDVIDIDPRNGGDKAWDSFASDHPSPTVYAEVATPSGGLHKYVARTRHAKVSRDGIDLQAGDDNGNGRGFVFLPGTERPSKATGEIRPYTVVRDALDGFGSDDHTGRDFLRWATEGNSTPPGVDGFGTIAPTGLAGGLGEPILANHDSTLAAYTASLVARGVRLEEAWQLVQVRLRDVVGGDSARPFTRADFDRWWAGAVRKYAPIEGDSLDGGSEPLTPHEQAVAREADRLRVQHAARAIVDAEQAPAGLGHTGRLIDGATFIFDQPDGIPALWGHGQDVLWAQGEALIIAGPPGVGKTTLAHQVVAAMVTGGDVLGLPVEAVPGRVLYLACDRPRQIARAMRRLLGDLDRDTIAERLVVWEGPPPGDFARDTELLSRMCAEARASVVVIDSLKDVALGLSEDAVGAGLNMSRQRALAAGVDVMELHHLVKRGENGSAPTKLTDLYGSAWITAGAGSVVLLWGEAGDTTVRLSHLKQPGSPVGPYMVTHDHQEGTSTVGGTTRVEDVAGWFRDGMSAKAGAAHIYDSDKPSKAEIETIRRACERAVNNGTLVRLPDTGGRGGGSDRNAARWAPTCPDLNHAGGRCTLESNHAGNHVHAQEQSRSNHAPSVIDSGPQSRNQQTRRSDNHASNHANHDGNHVHPPARRAGVTRDQTPTGEQETPIPDNRPGPDQQPSLAAPGQPPPLVVPTLTRDRFGNPRCLGCHGAMYTAESIARGRCGSCATERPT